MSLNSTLRRRMQQLLKAVDEHDTRGPRLIDDAARIWSRVQKFIAMGLVTAESDLDALELACYALELPQRQAKPPTGGKMARTNLKDRSEQAAELLVSMLDDVDEALLDRATRLLHEMPHRSPVPEEAKLLADALNLEDFGVIGLMDQMIQLARQGDGVAQLADGIDKREQYGYWEARLKDGFHFELVRQIATRRLDHARAAAKMLLEELKEDQPPGS